MPLILLLLNDDCLRPTLPSGVRNEIGKMPGGRFLNRFSPLARSSAYPLDGLPEQV
jgi:hypothetical protein